MLRLISSSIWFRSLWKHHQRIHSQCVVDVPFQDIWNKSTNASQFVWYYNSVISRKMRIIEASPVYCEYSVTVKTHSLPVILYIVHITINDFLILNIIDISVEDKRVDLGTRLPINNYIFLYSIFTLYITQTSLGALECYLKLKYDHCIWIELD